MIFPIKIAITWYTPFLDTHLNHFEPMGMDFCSMFHRVIKAWHNVLPVINGR